MRVIAKKFIAIVTTSAFFLTQLSRPSPVFAAAVREPPRHTNLHINLPAELGTLETSFSGNLPASRQAAPFLFHIQEPHGHYEAQKKIQGILHYLKDTYGVKLVLLEGSAFKLDPELGRFFPDRMDLTMAVMESLAKKSIVTGPELFLTKEKDVQAYGIESLEAYAANRKAFKEVMSRQDEASVFLKRLGTQIQKDAAAYCNPSLRRFLKRTGEMGVGAGFPRPKYNGSVAQGEGTSPLQSLPYLKEKAEKHLAIDLTDPAFQLDRPMLVRVFTLQRIEKKLDLRKFEEEREGFLKIVRPFIVGARFPRPSLLEGGETPPLQLFDEIARFLSSRLSDHPLPDPGTGLLFEQMASALPEDFPYSKYPNVNLFIGHLILQSELKGERLMKEIETLTDQIADHLAKSPKEKEIVRRLKDYRLLKKLLALELTPGEWERLDNTPRPLRGHPSREGNASPLYERGKRGVCASLFDKALAFYRGVRERDRWMLENIEKRLKETGETKAVIITGGFHAGPFKEYFQKRGYSYALLSPNITTPGSRESYIQSILGRSQPSARAVSSTLRSFENVDHSAGQIRLFDPSGFSDWKSRIVPVVFSTMEEEGKALGLAASELRALVGQTKFARQFSEVRAQWDHTVEFGGKKWRVFGDPDDPKKPKTLATMPFNAQVMKRAAEAGGVTLYLLDPEDPESEPFNLKQIMEVLKSTDPNVPTFHHFFVMVDAVYREDFFKAAAERIEGLPSDHPLKNAPRSLFSGTTGKDHIDGAAAEKYGFQTGYSPGFLTKAVEEFTWGINLYGFFRLKDSIERRPYPSSSELSELPPDSLEVAAYQARVAEMDAVFSRSFDQFDEIMEQVLLAEAMRQWLGLDDNEDYARGTYHGKDGKGRPWRNGAAGIRAPFRDMIGVDPVLGNSPKSIGIVAGQNMGKNLLRYVHALNVPQVYISVTEPAEERPLQALAEQEGVQVKFVDLKTLLQKSDRVVRVPGAEQITQELYHRRKRGSVVVDPMRLRVVTGKEDNLFARPLRGRTLGIVGLGRIGTAVTRLANALGMEILAHDIASDKPEYQVRMKELNQSRGRMGLNPAKFVATVKEMMTQSHIVSLHSSEKRRTDGTYAFDYELFEEALKAGILEVFSNTARGYLVDTAALVGFLRKRPEAVAVLDVLDEEGKMGDPNYKIEDELIFQLLNARIFGHGASKGNEARPAMYDGMVDGSLATIKGRAPRFPLNDLWKNNMNEPKPLEISAGQSLREALGSKVFQDWLLAAYVEFVYGGETRTLEISMTDDRWKTEASQIRFYEPTTVRIYTPKARSEVRNKMVIADLDEAFKRAKESEFVNLPDFAKVRMVNVFPSPGLFRLAVAVLEDRSVIPAHTHQGQETILVTEGQGEARIEGNRIPVRPGHSVDYPRGKIHTARWISGEKNSFEYILVFYPHDVARDPAEQVPFDRLTQVTPENHPNVMDLEDPNAHISDENLEIVTQVHRPQDDVITEISTAELDETILIIQKGEAALSLNDEAVISVKSMQAIRIEAGQKVSLRGKGLVFITYYLGKSVKSELREAVPESRQVTTEKEPEWRGTVTVAREHREKLAATRLKRSEARILLSEIGVRVKEQGANSQPDREVTPEDREKILSGAGIRERSALRRVLLSQVSEAPRYETVSVDLRGEDLNELVRALDILIVAAKVDPNFKLILKPIAENEAQMAAFLEAFYFHVFREHKGLPENLEVEGMVVSQDLSEREQTALRAQGMAAAVLEMSLRAGGRVPVASVEDRGVLERLGAQPGRRLLRLRSNVRNLGDHLAAALLAKEILGQSLNPSAFLNILSPQQANPGLFEALRSELRVRLATGSAA